MKKSRKITLIVLTSVTAFLLVAFTTLFMLMPVFVEGPTLASLFGEIGKLFTTPFMGGEGLPLALSIIALVVSGVWLVSLVLGIVVSCLKKRNIYLVYIPVMVLALFAALALLAYGQAFSLMIVSGTSLAVMLGIFYFLLGGLGFVLCYVTYALGLAWSKKVQQVEEVEIAPVAEEAADPERQYGLPCKKPCRTR